MDAVGGICCADKAAIGKNKQQSSPTSVCRLRGKVRFVSGHCAGTTNRPGFGRLGWFSDATNR
jgi:hypothetical protein